MEYKEYVGFLDCQGVVSDTKLRATNGVMYTETLFEETISSRMKKAGHEAIYSLRECPVSDLPSAYQIYINSTDETEAALKLVGSLAHWRKLCNLKWFISGRPEISFEGVLQWRKDMWERDRSESKKVLIGLCKSGNVTAARALHKMASEDLSALAKTTKPQSPVVDIEPDDGLGFLDNKG
jgi:hypothetical protein